MGKGQKKIIEKNNKTKKWNKEYFKSAKRKRSAESSPLFPHKEKKKNYHNKTEKSPELANWKLKKRKRKSKLEISKLVKLKTGRLALKFKAKNWVIVNITEFLLNLKYQT